MIRFFYKLLSRFLIWLAPIIIVLISIVYTLPNAELHKSTLSNSNFYNQLSSELQNTEVDFSGQPVGFGTVFLTTVLGDIATPGWLQSIFDRNIDNFTSWLVMEEDEFAIYLPAKDIELSVSQRINSEMEELSKNYGEEIPTCTAGQAEAIKQEGFALDNQLCIPESVKSGQQTFTEFLNLSSEDVENSDFLNQLINDNPLNPFNSNFKASDLPQYSNSRQGLFNGLDQFRVGFVLVRNSRVWILAVVVLALLALLILAALSQKKVTREFRRFLFYTSVGIFGLSAALILTLGGTVYFTSFVQNFLLPGVTDSEIVNLISFETVKFAFNLISYAFWGAVAMITLNFGLQYLEYSGFLNDFKERNEKMKSHKVHAPKEKDPNFKATTFDAQFRDQVAGVTSGGQVNSVSNPNAPVDPSASYFSTEIQNNQSYQVLGEQTETQFPNQSASSVPNPNSNTQFSSPTSPNMSTNTGTNLSQTTGPNKLRGL